MKRIVLPLHTESRIGSNLPIVKSSMSFIAIGPALLITLFFAGNFLTTQAINTTGRTWVDEFVEEKKAVAIYVGDRHYKKDQFRITVADESREVSDALRSTKLENNECLSGTLVWSYAQWICHLRHCGSNTSIL